MACIRAESRDRASDHFANHPLHAMRMSRRLQRRTRRLDRSRKSPRDVLAQRVDKKMIRRVSFSLQGAVASIASNSNSHSVRGRA